jgi:hypothetical protein
MPPRAHRGTVKAARRSMTTFQSMPAESTQATTSHSDIDVLHVTVATHREKRGDVPTVGGTGHLNHEVHCREKLAADGVR